MGLPCIATLRDGPPQTRHCELTQKAGGVADSPQCKLCTQKSTTVFLPSPTDAIELRVSISFLLVSQVSKKLRNVWHRIFPPVPFNRPLQDSPTQQDKGVVVKLGMAASQNAMFLANALKPVLVAPIDSENSESPNGHSG